MSRLRCNLVPLLVMLPVIFVCGKLLLTPVNAYVLPNGVPSPDTLDEYDQGWPWVFREVQFHVHTRQNVGNFSFGLLFGDLVVLFTLIVATWWLICWLKCRAANWRQFSLRSLFVLTAVAAIACGWWMHHLRQAQFEQPFIKQINSNGDVVNCGDDFDAPEWLRRFVADEHLSIFRRITSMYVFVPSNESNLPKELTEAIPRFSRLRSLFVGNKPYEVRSSDGRAPLRIKNVAALQELQELKFREGTADDETLSSLDQLPQLKSLEVELCPISDCGLASVAVCKSLEKLKITYCRSVTSGGLVHLHKLNQLTELTIDSIEIDDTAIDSLLQMKSLRRLNLFNPQLTDRVARRLVELPNLKTLYLDSDLPLKLSAETLKFLKAHIPGALPEVLYE